MKLIHYTIGRLAIVVLIIMAFWSVFFYFQIVDEVYDETDDSLKNYKKIVIKQMLRDADIPRSHTDILTRYYITEIPADVGKHYREHFETTEAFNEYEMDDEPVRLLRTAFKTENGQYYELTIMTSIIEEDDMLESILWSIVYLYVAGVICILFVSHWMFRKSFRPFYALMGWLDNFTVGKPNTPLVNETRVTEFRRLNKAIAEMAGRNETVFHEQKRFIENASHELQTPLAICRNKLELLAESPACTEELLNEIGDIHQTLDRIIRLNKSLLLLSRIENRQYTEVKNVVFNTILHGAADDFKDIYAYRNIRIEIKEEGVFSCQMNEMLSVVLMTNLLKNAIVHSPDCGAVNIGITVDEVRFANDAVDGPLDDKKVFQRFYHAGGKKESTGLGLAIVKSITDMYGLRIDYRYDGRHHFCIRRNR